MEFINPAENWKKLLESFIKKSVLVILNKRLKSNKNYTNDPINKEVIFVQNIIWKYHLLFINFISFLQMKLSQ